MIKCRKELEKFVDCVDALRLEVIKSKFMPKIQDKLEKSGGISEGSECPGPKKKVYLSD